MRSCVFLKKFTILVVLKVATVGCLNTILFTILPKANVVPGRTGVYSYSFSTRLRGPCYGTMVTNLCHCRESNLKSIAWKTIALTTAPWELEFLYGRIFITLKYLLSLYISVSTVSSSN